MSGGMMEVKGGNRGVVVHPLRLRHDEDSGERVAHLRKLIVKRKSASTSDIDVTGKVQMDNQ